MKKKSLLKSILYSIFSIFLIPVIYSQSPSKTSIQKTDVNSSKAAVKFISGKEEDLFGKNKAFIENIGQYGDTIPGYSNMGHILFGYEGLDMPIFFTSKGLVHLLRKIKKLDHEEMEKLEKKGEKEEELIQQRTIIDRTITGEWLNANPNVTISTEEPLST
ncbi:MAG: hypothetical protein ACJ748_00920 [Flavisolibacter sp.]